MAVSGLSVARRSGFPGSGLADLLLTCVLLSAFAPATWALDPPLIRSPGAATWPGPILTGAGQTFTWTRVSDATSYELCVRDLVTDTQVVYQTGIPGPDSSVSGLTAGHSYRWNVYSVRSGTRSPISSALYFRVEAASPVAPFKLSFPLKGQDVDDTSYTSGPHFVPIRCVFDHGMSWAGDRWVNAGNRVVAFTGEVGDTLPGVETTLSCRAHRGFDFRAADGTPVAAAAGGVVSYPNGIPGLSNAAAFHTLAIDHQNGYVTYYLHLSTHPSEGTDLVKPNLTVRSGDLIGRVGHAAPTGTTVSPHLHFEVHHLGVPVDPYGWQKPGEPPEADPYYSVMAPDTNVCLWSAGGPSVDLQGPGLTIAAPAADASVSGLSLSVYGTASDGIGGNGVSSVTVNGVAALYGTESGSRTANWIASVQLPEGRETITVVAKDSLGNSTTRSRTVDVVAGLSARTLAMEVRPANGGSVSQSPPPAARGSHADGTLAKPTEPSPRKSPAAVLASGDMVLIPAGPFSMGSTKGGSKEQPVHVVTLDAFFMDRYPVTNQRYRQFVQATGHPAPSGWQWTDFNGDDQPVVGVSWDDATAYATWAGKRLPTEAEWEKAARGGLEGLEYPWGNEDPAGRACFCLVQTSPVGSFASNGYGLYDMAGNVREWVADWYDESYYSASPRSNPRGPATGTGRVLRGGTWRSSYDLRCAYRFCYGPAGRFDDIGFRCVSSVP